MVTDEKLKVTVELDMHGIVLKSDGLQVECVLQIVTRPRTMLVSFHIRSSRLPFACCS